LSAARAVFSERGYEDTTTADIAERAGVVEGTLYHYFPTKRAILMRMLEEWHAEVLPEYPKILPHIEGARAKLRFLVWQHLRVVHDDPVLCKFGIEVRDYADYKSTQVYVLNERYRNATIEVVADGVASGEFKAGFSPQLVRDTIFGAIECTTEGYLRGEGDFSIDDLADQIVELVCAGISERPPAESLDSIVARLEEVATRLKE
jgi:AcrR family transcriptional regulator